MPLAERPLLQGCLNPGQALSTFYNLSGKQQAYNLDHSQAWPSVWLSCFGDYESWVTLPSLIIYS